MDFPGFFKDHILPGQIHVLNVSFTVKTLRKHFGGTAANIAYSLSLLEQSCVILGAVGEDFGEYADWLERHGISTSTLTRVKEDFTASATIMTDLSNNQITAFHPGALFTPTLYDFPKLDPEDWAILAPGNLDDMKRYKTVYQQRGIRHIFDPGQILPILEPAALKELIAGATILMINDYEAQLIQEKCRWTQEELRLAVETLIVTRGAQGSSVWSPTFTGAIGIAKPSNIIDPTGAGDAYRSGLLFGLLRGLPIEQCSRLGATAASYPIEHHGTQEHTFTIDQFRQRYEASFGESFPIKP
jgi:adenosine kinase